MAGSLDLAFSDESPGSVDVAIQYHIDDEPYFPREPWSTLWLQTEPGYALRFEGPTRLSLHTAQDTIFTSLIPVLEGGEIDFERLRGWRAGRRSVVFGFEASQSVRLDPTTKSVWARFNDGSNGLSERMVGRILTKNSARLCTGEFRTVCALKIVGESIRILPPIDWSQQKLTIGRPNKIQSCSDSELQRRLGDPLLGTSKYRLEIQIHSLEDSLTSCDALIAEIERARQIYLALGIHLDFQTMGLSGGGTLKVEIRGSVDESRDGSSGHFEELTNLISLGQPRFGFRLPNVLAHEIGHALGLSHVGDSGNLMVGSGITENDDSLTPEQQATILKSPLLK